MRRDVMPIEGRLVRADVPRLCDRARRRLERSGAEVLVCDVGGIVADAVALEALARLQLTARRLGRRLRLANVPLPLQELLAFSGLSAVLLAVEAGRQAEQREQALGVEEGVQPHDPAA
jgi:ABC-type transporter Mla MlaB component